MRRILTAALLGATLVGGVAHPARAGLGDLPSQAPPRRRPAPEGITPEALARFIDAVLADKAGDVEDAIRRYQDALRLAPHAAIHWNLGDLYRRAEDYRRAIDAYRKFVELSTAPRDKAEGERVIAQIKASPGVVVIDGEDLDAIVFIDGKLVGPSPVIAQLPDGRHVADRIGPTSHRSRSFTTSGSSREHVTSSSAELTGNVVLSTSMNRLMSWDEEATGVRYSLPGRLQLAPGRHATTPFNSVTCQPITFDVPKGDGVTFVFVDATGPARPGGCVPIKVTQQPVRFPR